MTNRRIVVLFVLLVTLSLVSALGAEIYNKYVLSDAFYLSSLLISENFAWDALTFFILYNNLIPISLQVTLEFVRFFQAYYINMAIFIYFLKNIMFTSIIVAAYGCSNNVVKRIFLIFSGQLIF